MTGYPIEKDDIQKPQYVVCHVMLSNDALRLSRLERNLTITHPMLKEKPLLEEFWVKYRPIYPENVQNEALKVLVQFLPTYLCESGFSSLAVIKTKYRNRLDVESDLRCSLSNILPIIQKNVWSAFTLILNFIIYYFNFSL